MKKIMILALSAILAGCASNGKSGDEVHFMPIADALNSPEAAKVLNPNVKLVFAKSNGAKVIRSGLVSNRKTGRGGKTKEFACQWAFLAAIKQFQATAVKNNASQVVNLISYYKKQPYSSPTQYECRIGALMVGVALKGDIAQ